MLGVPVGVHRYPWTQNRVGIKGDMGGLRLKIGRIKVLVRTSKPLLRTTLNRTVHALSLNVSLLRGFPDPRQTPIKKTCGLEGGLPILVRVRHIGSVHQQFVARVRVIPSCSINQRVVVAGLVDHGHFNAVPEGKRISTGR